MRVELLGTGGYFANDRRHTACVLFPEIGLIFDAGSALYRAYGRSTDGTFRIFLTHAHLDHIVGLPVLLVPLLRGELTQVTLYGSAETLAAVQSHLLETRLFPVPIPFRYEPILPTGTLKLDEAHMLSWQPLPSHPGGSIAYRLDQTIGQTRTSVSYVTDTQVDGSYSEFIRNSDLLIHECNFADSLAELAAISGHSTASDVGRLAATTGVRKLVVVHVDACSEADDPIGLPDIQAHFPDVTLGADGMVIDL